MTRSALITLLIILLAATTPAAAQSILLKNVTLIDGNGKRPQYHTDILINGDTIAAIGKGLQHRKATAIDLRGKTIMPALISTHVHIGILKDTLTAGVNYTRENILRQLKRYEDYGISHVLAMGTDRPMLFASGLRDSSQAGLLPGARLHSAGYGFTIPKGIPPAAAGMDLLFRPADAAAVTPLIDSVAGVHPAVIKMWVDDAGGRFPKMDSTIYQAIITRAHQRGIRVAAHLYTPEDARRLTAAGLDVFAHSVRSKEIDVLLLQEMKRKGVVYIPTLSLDVYNYSYAQDPYWLKDDFFKASLEPGVYGMITSAAYKEKIRKDPDLPKKIAASRMGLRNVKKVYKAGILVALGTDSGAFPERAQGFSEHLELELLVKAGLTPLEAIGVATKNAARVLKIDQTTGTLTRGKVADFIILAANPEKDIRHTRKIVAVYKAGKKVSDGPKL
ncbi:amidohydrolase family protein [Chitinophaga nivalis]|uniref:Amidohydrolase family protein n=1 Tax=Chitinophaga nivalis TaxID=2991709 RepID=A0ABT3IQT5_9BACT|nr:amidohydrolase family protein [Chitinophaga nivalis]MCW3464002.1 amidohydrolase family protein [Chitinophaga nivalis]MCW3486308.1 amidohydrolase family protein [Chitinophaga nivalis]